MEQAPKFEGNIEEEKKPMTEERYAEIEGLLLSHPEGKNWMPGLSKLIGESKKLFSEMSKATNISEAELEEFWDIYGKRAWEEGDPEETKRLLEDTEHMMDESDRRAEQSRQTQTEPTFLSPGEEYKFKSSPSEADKIRRTGRKI